MRCIKSWSGGLRHPLTTQQEDRAWLDIAPMDAKRINRGRPVKPDGKARKLALPSIRVNPDEMSFIAAQAAIAGQPVSTYVRNLVLGKKVTPPRTDLEDRLLFELNRCGVNLHQIVKALNFGQSLPNDIATVTSELKTAIAKVSSAYDA